MTITHRVYYCTRKVRIRLRSLLRECLRFSGLRFLSRKNRGKKVSHVQREVLPDGRGLEATIIEE